MTRQFDQNAARAPIHAVHDGDDENDLTAEGRLAPLTTGSPNGADTNGASTNGASMNGAGANGAVATNGSAGTVTPVVDGPSVRARPGAARRPAKRATVSLVIPAKNEARNLPSVLRHVPARVDEVILVDGQSTDVTQLMAVSCRPDIRIVLERDRGKGHALRSGFAAATGDIIVAMDADGSMHPEEIPNFVWFLEHGFDFVKGSRFVAGGGSLDLTPLRKMGNRALLVTANTIYRTRLTDLCYGFFAFYRKYLDHLDLMSSGFEIETELTIRAVLAGLRIAEIPSMEMPRRSGRSSLRSFPDGARVLRTILRERDRSEKHRA